MNDREIISIQIGQCGNKIGSMFWEMISREHELIEDGTFKGISDYDIENIFVYFNENKQGKFIPRTILVDIDKEIINTTKSSSFLQLINNKNIISGNSNAHANWASCFYNSDPEFGQQILDIIRKEAEKCNSLQGIQLIHSLGGGTGSGLGSLILDELRYEYPDETLSTFSVFPSPKVSDATSDTHCDPYNCVLALDQLNETADQVFYFDNESLYNYVFNKLRLSTPTVSDLNYCIACQMSGATCSLRFPDLLNSDLRKLSVNLIPFARLKFLKSTFALQTSRGGTHCHIFDVDELTSNLFNKENVDYFAASLNFHGRFVPNDISEHMKVLNSRFHSIDINASICPKKIEHHWKSATLIENSTGITNILQRQILNFLQMFRKRAFVYKFIEEGLDSTELDIAKSNLDALIQEYHKYSNEM